MKKRARWKRIPCDIIQQHPELMDTILKYVKSGDRRWPYLCDNVVKWKKM